MRYRCVYYVTLYYSEQRLWLSLGLLLMQKYPISPMTWGIAGREDIPEYLTHDHLLNSRSVRGPFAVENRKGNVCWSERSPGVIVVYYRARTGFTKSQVVGIEQ